MSGNGNFGVWIEDNYGLPAYNYNCNQLISPRAKTPTTYGFSIDHFHQIGNDRITATVHNGGYVQVLESSRGFQWLTYKDENRKKLCIAKNNRSFCFACSSRKNFKKNGERSRDHSSEAADKYHFAN